MRKILFGLSLMVAGFVAGLSFIPQSVMSQSPADLLGGIYNLVQPTLADKQQSVLQLDANGNLRTTAGAGGGGTASTFGAAFPGMGTAIGVKSGANMTNLTADGSNNLNVNCASGCSGGSFNNNSDNVATSAANGQAAAWNYVWDGSAWDRLYGDSTNGVFANIKTSVLPTGASTSAKQPALGTAGASSADVISIQGIASMTKLLVTPDSVALPANQSVNVSQMNGVATTMGNGVAGTGVQRVAIASDNTAFSVNAIQSGTWNVNAVQSGAWNINTSTINGVTPLMGNGVTGTGSQRVTIASDNTAFAVNATLSAETTKVIGTVRNVGNAGAAFDGAAGSAVPANILLQGLRAQNVEATAVTNSASVAQAADLVGKTIILPYANPENFENGTTAAITDTTSTSVIASAGGSLRHYVTDCMVTNSHATVGTFVQILDGSTVLDSGFAAAAGGGFSRTYPVPRRGTAATALNCQATTTGANFKCSCGAYKGV